MAALVPAVRASVQDVGGVLGDQTGAQISAHGSRAEDGVSMLDGLRIERVRVPLGVVAIIYENRPNVTSDAATCTRART